MSMEGDWLTSWCHFLNFHLQSRWETKWFEIWWGFKIRTVQCDRVHVFTYATLPCLQALKLDFSNSRNKATEAGQPPRSSHWNTTQTAFSAYWVQALTDCSHIWSYWVLWNRHEFPSKLLVNTGVRTARQGEKNQQHSESFSRTEVIDFLKRHCKLKETEVLCWSKWKHSS